MPPKVAAKKTNKGSEKAAEQSKAKADAKKKGHEAKKTTCAVCSLGMPNPATYKQQKCNTIIYSCLCGSHIESVQEGKAEIRYHIRQTQF